MYSLLEKFGDAFRQQYRHRDQTIGNSIAMYVYDDLLRVAGSAKYVEGVTTGRVVVNASNRVRGRAGRRGDGTLGHIIPGETATQEEDYKVQRGPIADLRIGAEMKILAKSMIKQIDRVITDLEKQAATFRRQSPDAICVGFVGVNVSPEYTSYEGDRSYPCKIAPSREAPEAIRRIETEVRSKYDELLIIKFRATNVPPFPFSFENESGTRQDYAAALHRISAEYQRRF